MEQLMTRVVILIGLILGLTSCATTTPPSNPTLSWQNRQMVLSQIQQWQLTGKIGIQTTQNAGSATLNWTENAERHYVLSLTGPLGAGSIKLIGQPGSVEMQTADGHHYTASTPEQLLNSQLGWDLPVSYLYYWIRGIPVPDLPSQTQFDAYHRLIFLIQQNVQVQFLSYSQVGTVDLPNKIFITSPMVKAKIIIYEWKLV